jgi:hypothetical protein
MINVDFIFEPQVSEADQQRFLTELRTGMPDGVSVQKIEGGAAGTLDQIDPHSMQCVIEFLVEVSKNPLIISLTTAAVTELVKFALKHRTTKKLRSLHIDDKEIPLS